MSSIAETNMDLTVLAETLWQARVRAEACSPLTELEPQLSIESAYEISRLNFQRRLKTQPRTRLVGRKIGLTSLAVQKQLGVGEPDFGYLTSDMVVEHDGEIPASQLIQPRVEGEVAFIMGRALQGPGVSFEDVLRATDHVVGCIEVIDSRVRDWKIRIQDTVADNASSAMLVLGTRSRKPDAEKLDLRMAGMALRVNGEVESTGVGRACLDHPANAVAWLANRLGSFGEGLQEGDIVLSGAYGPVVPFRPGDRIEVEISGLGVVRCSRGAV